MVDIRYTVARDEAQRFLSRRKPAEPVTFLHCTGPCKQGRSICPSPEACQLGEPLTWRQTWLDFPVAGRVSIILVASICLAAVTLHQVLK